MGGECYHHCVIPTPIHQAKCNIAKLNGLSSFFVRIHKWISKLRCLNSFFSGTDGKSFAGFRACYCLKGYFRKHMFEECEPCKQGLKCENESINLQQGYWWKWENDTNKELYKSFGEVLRGNFSVSNKTMIEYPNSLPRAHKCPRPESCLGGTNSTCDVGYEGPLCEVCSPEYYKQLKTCKKCPTKTWMIAQLSVIAAVAMF